VTSHEGRTANGGLSAPGRRARRPRPQPTGWASLTRAELKVTLLAAEGLTNRQIGEQLFTSHRTVETHLAHVYDKLGFVGRARLAAEVVRHGVGSAI
jgi:DNA-binding CsgD family transcriptional regulator